MNLFFTRPDPYLHLGTFPLPRTVSVRIDGVPDCMHGLRALFISDVHLRDRVPDEKLQLLMAQIASQKADLLLLGGDYAESKDACLRFFKALKGISFPLGIYAVPGNNDFESMPTLGKTLQEAGGTLLVNESRRISLPRGELEIGGCDDHEYGSPCTKNIFRTGGSAYRILLSHFPVAPECPCELMLSGHTHAGQFNGFGLTPYSIGFEHSYHLLGVRGIQKIGTMQLLIGNGIGVSRIPMRIGAQPQIYLLEFANKELR